jgi:predicted transposase YbfD/YdcC
VIEPALEEQSSGAGPTSQIGVVACIHHCGAARNQHAPFHIGVIAGSHLATAEKSNEITAIPQLLELLVLKGCIVTIDAIGCQKAIAEQIVAHGADYVLAVKDNQPALYEAVCAQAGGFAGVPVAYTEETDAGHGRTEVRRCWLVEDLSTLPDPHAWRGLRRIVQVQAERHQGDQVSCANRYYITSLADDSKQVARAVRAHWGIENQLHWVLDVTFREDDSPRPRASSRSAGRLPLTMTTALRSCSRTEYHSVALRPAILNLADMPDPTGGNPSLRRRRKPKNHSALTRFGSQIRLTCVWSLKIAAISADGAQIWNCCPAAKGVDALARRADTSASTVGFPRWRIYTPIRYLPRLLSSPPADECTEEVIEVNSKPDEDAQHGASSDRRTLGVVIMLLHIWLEMCSPIKTVVA